ncbi:MULTISPECIES: SAM-dependent methyltransferase [Streptomyces]|uniref:N5-glutamine S-adenosyl-L-methionine-dependent methyltransferase n=1 Tax=Streptomyces chartreusis NRRL 3882 TaxID=1079985 RepID=A0A2N9BAW5_STRCX|nr:MULTISPECIES: class I SAM-dependent methyltransferase [Streptomyces]MYS91387.1 methyltransferase domain-containing protein [Streptomyces sp. SID5464]SOR80493.1 N5-glutamine S-adenosyl-L-methionine-dependent methyltransferase [Streptomyces chartreusis NRRL 3882]
MTTPPRHTRLTFHGPLSEARADQLVARLARNAPATVLDIGCGWGELMLRLLTALPEATGTGIDINAEDLARGQRAAEERGLAPRARFLEESATGTSHGPADLVLCVGASQALSGELPAALEELRGLVSDHGRVLLGEGFWQRTPTPAELSRMWPDAAVTDHPDLATLVGLAIEAGFRPEWTQTASLDEWEEFESAYLADTEVWLAQHPGHPLAAETRERADRHRTAWLTYRGVLGLAYLTLVPVAR